MHDKTGGLREAVSFEHDFERASIAASHAPDLTVLLDRNGQILWASPSHGEILGYTAEELVGRQNLDLVHPDDHERVRAAIANTLHDPTPSTLDLRLVRSDGQIIDVESTGVGVPSAGGRIERVVVTARDIRERRSIERRMRVLLNQIPANVWTTDRDLNVTSSAGGGLSIVNVYPDFAVGASLSDLLAGDELHDAAIELHRHVLSGQSFVSETRWHDRNLHVRMHPLRDEAGEISGVIGISLDVTEQRRAEQRYRALFERNVAGVFRSTVSGRMLECNDSFARIFGYDSPAEIAAHGTTALYFDLGAREQLVELLRKSGEAVNYEVCLKRKDGNPVWALINEKLSPGDDGAEDILEGTLIDITARKVAEERIEYQAFHDALTDLPNRFLFNDRLALALAQARRHSRAVAVLFLDLDHFKLVNDTMAHSAGDELLRAVAARLASCLRGEDTVARLGGDEFVFILPEIEQPSAAAGAARVAEKILEAIRHPFVVQSRELFVTASIGIAIAPHDGEDTELLVRNADTAMYRAKELGRNNYQFHTPLAQRRAEVRLTLETALRRAIERDELFLAYQPIYQARGGRIVGMEALLRWRRAGGVVVEPKDFIGLAEEIGVIVPIGEWVFWTACRQMQAWHAAGAQKLRLSINLSPRQFQDDGLIRMVENVLAETQLDARLLELEITESLSIHDSDLTIGRLSHFRAKGIGVSLDDFGTGYSSLAHLRYLPITALKIDRSFVDGIGSNGAERTIVCAMIAMAHSLGLRVVAEGVETPEQQSILADLDCDELQGFLRSEPLTADAATDLLNL